MNDDDPDERPPPKPWPARARTDSPDGELLVRNLQRRHPVDRRELRAFLRDVAEVLGATKGAATLALVGDARIQELNREFRGFDKPTDVLSFGTGLETDTESLEPPYLGDIVISVETAERQARRRGGSLALELKVLVLHGFLHLLGYDHETDSGEMRRVEYRLRRRFRITRPRGARPPASTVRMRRAR